MKTKKIFMALLLCGGMMLSGCQKEVDVPITEDRLECLKGEFYGKSGKLTITAEGATLDNGETTTVLTNKKVKGTGSKTKLYYSSENGEYVVSIKGTKKSQVFVTNGGVEEEFQPSIESIQGWYTGDGESGAYYISYIVSNEFDKESGYFLAGNASTTSGVFDNLRAKSYFYKLNSGEYALGWEFYYASDLSEVWFSTYASKDEEKGKIYLNSLPNVLEGIEEGDQFFTSAVSIMDYTYFDAEEAALYGGMGYGFGFYYDSETKTVMIAPDYEEVAYTEGFDEKGCFVKIGDDKYRGTVYGMVKETADATIEYPYYDVNSYYDIYYTDFVSGETTISYTMDWDTYEDTVTVDYVSADSFQFVVYNHKMAINFTVGEDNYYLLPYDGDSAIEIIKNGSSEIFLNYYKFVSLFAKDYYTADGSIISVDWTFGITKGEESYVGTLKYDTEIGVVLCFNGYEVAALNEEEGLFLIMPEDKSSYSVLVDTYFVSELFGDWTCGTFPLTLGDNSITINGIQVANKFAFSFVATSVAYLPAISFTINNENHLLVLSSGSGLALYFNGTEALELIAGFVPQDMFDAIIGDYCYVGNYGVETVSLAKDGKLVVDTSNETKDGIIPVEYDYFAYLYEGKVCLQYEYEGIGVSITFDGAGHCSIFVISYLGKAYFDNQGIFLDESNIVTVVDSKIKYNGKLVTVDEYKDGTLTGTVNGSSIKIVFSDSSIEVTVGDNAPITLTKSNVSFSSFTGRYENVGGLGYDVEIKADGIYWGMSGSALSKLTVDYSFEIVDGLITLKFSYAGIDYTATIDGSTVTMTAVSNIPVPPPFIG